MKLSFPSVLTLIFITLKLTHVITWSWIWVLAPAWMSFLIAFLILVCVAAISILSILLETKTTNKTCA